MFRSIRFLGSLKVAAPLLVAIAAVLGWGTIYEARFGTAAVQRTVYQSGWFQALLGFLAINLAAAAFQRAPWQRKHLPFVLAHLGIILILIGGIIGGRFGIDGQLIIPEGETNSALQLSHNVLVVHQPNPGVYREFPTHFEAAAWNHQPQFLLEIPLGKRTLQVVVDRYYPNADRSEEILPDGDSDNPAVRVWIGHEEREDRAWLFARDPDRFGARWGDAHLFFVEPESPAQLAQLLGSSEPMEEFPLGIVRVEFPDLKVRREIPVPQEKDKTVSIEGTPYQITFKDYFKDFALSESGPVNRSDEPKNPAVALTLSGPEGTDPHLLFALHPDFAVMHGRQQKIHSHISFVHSVSSDLPPNSITMIKVPSGSLLALLKGGPEEKEIIEPVQTGTEYAHPQLGYRFKVEEFYPRAKVNQQYKNKDNEVRREVLHLISRLETQVLEEWIPLRGTTQFPFGDPADPVVVEYRPAARTLPFSVKLLDFRKIDYPGTQMAAGFESDLELTDAQRGVTLKRKISMNNPLKYRGFTLFQSSYVPGPVETTVLSVRNDPGTPLVYAGFLIVLAGIASLFISRRKRAVLSLILLAAIASSAGSAFAEPKRSELSPAALEQLRHIPIQSAGRVKPLDSFAWEVLDRLTGDPRWGGRPPVETVLSMAADPSAWQEAEILSVPFIPLREALGLNPKAKHVSYARLVEEKKLMRMLPAIVEKQQNGEKLTMLENETMDLYDRFVTITEIFQQKLKLVPPPRPEGNIWAPVVNPEGYSGQERQALREAWEGLLASLQSPDAPAVGIASRLFVQQLREMRPGAYPPAWKLRLEVIYNDLAPFRIARILYGLAALAWLVFAGWNRRRLLSWAGIALTGAALFSHGSGILTRVVLGGRPPVSNFYETMLWLPFVAMILALIFERVYRSGFFAFSGCFLASVALLLLDHLPLDPSISPVVAVLRSNLWLTIHVLTVVGSYAPIALAAVLAHLYAGIYFFRGQRHPALPGLALFLYRSIQVGVVLLATGIMLGAVWANASWGRYWGWDPKETWALITLLWYVSLLHGRYAGWLKGTGLALGTIGGFFLLLMTYYGVSFYLVGLHSYAGGNAKPVPLSLIAYLIGEAVFIGAVGLKTVLRGRQPV